MVDLVSKKLGTMTVDPVAKKLASNENKVTLGSITAATVPYFTNYKHDKNAKEEINKK